MRLEMFTDGLRFGRAKFLFLKKLFSCFNLEGHSDEKTSAQKAESQLTCAV